MGKPTKTPPSPHQHILDDFESAIAAQMARIQTRLTRVEVRRRARRREDDGPIIVEGGSTLAHRGDDVDVRVKK